MSNKAAMKRRPSRPLAAPRPSRTPWIVGAVVVFAVVAALVTAVALQGGESSGNDTLSGPAPAAVVKAVTDVPTSVIDEVGGGTAERLPDAVPAGTPATSPAKPEVLYIGAEYCPYCAAQRWALVNALSRFGTFTNLGQTHSSSTDTFPDTATFTFRGSTFASDALTFTAVETASNQPGPDGAYEPLATPTARQQQAWKSLDRAGSIPFVRIGDRYFVSGATVDPAVLEGKSMAEIADALADPSSDISKSVIGAANGLTAAICEATGGAPANVCDAAGVAPLRAQLAAG